MSECPLHLHCESIEDELHMRLETQMLGAEGARQINEAIKDALDMDGKGASTTPNVVRVDLAQVSGMGSAAIGAFIVLHKSLDAKACRLELDNPNKSIREALEFLKLDRVLTITSRQ